MVVNFDYMIHRRFYYYTQLQRQICKCSAMAIITTIIAFLCILPNCIDVHVYLLSIHRLYNLKTTILLIWTYPDQMIIISGNSRFKSFRVFPRGSVLWFLRFILFTADTTSLIPNHSEQVAFLLMTRRPGSFSAHFF